MDQLINKVTLESFEQAKKLVDNPSIGQKIEEQDVEESSKNTSFSSNSTIESAGEYKKDTAKMFILRKILRSL